MKEKKHGFILESTRELPELSGKLHQVEHEQSGARLVWNGRRKTRPLALLSRPSPGMTPAYFIFWSTPYSAVLSGIQ